MALKVTPVTASRMSFIAPTPRFMRGVSMWATGAHLMEQRGERGEERMGGVEGRKERRRGEGGGERKEEMKG